MKKILIFCLFCVVFTLIPAVSVLAGGGQDEKEKKPFPAAETPADEGDTFYVSETTPADEKDSFVIPADEPAPVPEISANENRWVDQYAQDSFETNAFPAVETAVPPPPPPQPLPPPPVPQPQPAPSRAPPQPPVRTIAPTVNIIMPPSAVPANPSAAAPSGAIPPVYSSSMNIIPGMPDPHGSGVYRVQLGAFSNTDLAERCFNRLKSAGFTPYYEQYGSLYRVVISGVKAVDMAAVICRLESAGFREAWIREER